ncbi:MAG: sulfotransferase [Calditrichaeota bacterium]|nr:MAG: sulfotransferase [Calditrichota bacterium]
MNQKLRDDPVIVLGMHHSGTSILARILHENGVFMQANMRHYEAKFFVMEIHERLVMGDEAGWARNPIMPVEEVMSYLEPVKRVIERKGFRKYIDAGYDGHSRWGFKDPRTCVLLPLYLKIFPRAQLVHIVRNAEDVAASLAANEKRGVGVQEDRAFWKSLWQQYVDRVRQYGQQHPQYFELTYEDFCRQPVPVVTQIFDYLGIPFTAKAEQFLRENIYTHRINIS